MNLFLIIHSRQKGDDDDIVDSDFSIDENDELKSDNEEETKVRKKGVSTKAYKVS